MSRVRFHKLTKVKNFEKKKLRGAHAPWALIRSISGGKVWI